MVLRKQHHEKQRIKRERKHEKNQKNYIAYSGTGNDADVCGMRR